MLLITEQIPDDHRRILLDCLRGVKADSFDNQPEDTPEHFIYVTPTDFKRLNLSSVLENNNGRYNIGFTKLASRFAREQRLTPWWAWLTELFTGKNRIISSIRTERGLAAYALEVLVDRLIQELARRRFSQSDDSWQEDPFNSLPPEAYTRYGQSSPLSDAPPPSDPKLAELYKYIVSLGVGASLAHELMNNDLLHDLLGSLHDVRDAEIRLQDVEGILSDLENSLIGADLDSDAGREISRKIQQIRGVKQDAQVVAFIKNQVETSINVAILHYIRMNSELAYLLPGLLDKSHDKIRLLASQLSYLQQILSRQMTQQTLNALQAQRMEGEKVIVAAQLTSELSMHLDNIVRGLSGSLPDAAENIRTLENIIKNISIMTPEERVQIQAPESLTSSVRVEQSVAVLDVERMLQEMVKSMPQINSEVTEIARVITQNFGAPVVEHRLLVAIAPDVYATSPMEPGLAQREALGSVEIDPQTHRVRDVKPLPENLKTAEVKDIARIAEDAISFNVSLKHTIHNAAEILRSGMHAAGFADNNFTLGEYDPVERIIPVSASLKQALDLSKEFKHRNAIHTHAATHTKTHEPGRG